MLMDGPGDFMREKSGKDIMNIALTVTDRDHPDLLAVRAVEGN